MESNNNGNNFPDFDLDKIPGENPNMEPNPEPNEPLISSEEKSPRQKRRERNKINSRNMRTKLAEQEGRVKKKYENLDHLNPWEKKARAREQSNA